jgi:hypothetical protein
VLARSLHINDRLEAQASSDREVAAGVREPSKEPRPGSHLPSRRRPLSDTAGPVGSAWTTSTVNSGDFPAELRRGYAKAPLVERPRAGTRSALEDPQVERAVVHGGDVAAPPRRDHVAAQNLGQLRHIRLNHVSSSDRWLFAPDLVHEPGDGHDLVRMHEQKGQQRALARAAEARRRAADKRLERAEHPKLESEPVRA